MWLIWQGLVSSFCSTKQLRLFLFPLDDMLVHHRAKLNSPIRISYTCTERVTCLRAQHNVHNVPCQGSNTDTSIRSQAQWQWVHCAFHIPILNFAQWLNFKYGFRCLQRFSIVAFHITYFSLLIFVVQISFIFYDRDGTLQLFLRCRPLKVSLYLLVN